MKLKRTILVVCCVITQQRLYGSKNEEQGPGLAVPVLSERSLSPLVGDTPYPSPTTPLRHMAQQTASIKGNATQKAPKKLTPLIMFKKGKEEKNFSLSADVYGERTHRINPEHMRPLAEQLNGIIKSQKVLAENLQKVQKQVDKAQENMNKLEHQYSQMREIVSKIKKPDVFSSTENKKSEVISTEAVAVPGVSEKGFPENNAISPRTHHRRGRSVPLIDFNTLFGDDKSREWRAGPARHYYQELIEAKRKQDELDASCAHLNCQQDQLIQHQETLHTRVDALVGDLQAVAQVVSGLQVAPQKRKITLIPLSRASSVSTAHCQSSNNPG